MDKRLVIRKIKVNELLLLEDIIIDALRLWKYSSDEIDRLRERLRVSDELVQKSVIYIAESEGEVVGFWLQELKNDLSESRFYIKREFINKNIGTKLWKYATSKLKEEYKLEYITFISDANAQGFYEKMGALKIDEQISEELTDQMLPIMKYYLK